MCEVVIHLELDNHLLGLFCFLFFPLPLNFFYLVLSCLRATCADKKNFQVRLVNSIYKCIVYVPGWSVSMIKKVGPISWSRALALWLL